MSEWQVIALVGAGIVFYIYLQDQARARRIRRRACPACREERLRSRGRWVLGHRGWRLRPLSRRELAGRRRLPMPDHTCGLTRKQLAERARLRSRIYSHNRRVRIVTSVGSYTVQEWTELVARFDACPGCGRVWKDIRPIRGRRSAITVDHVIPLSRGGTNNASNLQPLCHSCNSAKGTRLSWEGSRTLALKCPRCHRVSCICGYRRELRDAGPPTA